MSSWFLFSVQQFLSAFPFQMLLSLIPIPVEFSSQIPILSDNNSRIT